MKYICKTFSQMSATLHDESNEHNLSMIFEVVL
jgi:hypothetical protein